MLEVLGTEIGELLGLGVESPSLGQAMLRAVLIYAAALALVRAGEKRFLGKSTAFDVILAVMLGSVVSRGITGNAPLLPSLGAAMVLVGLHWLAAAIAFRSDRLGGLVKGQARMLIKDGEIQWDAMRHSHITQTGLYPISLQNGAGRLS
jgi:uncharacterized membrane protein YcaP (DUF421 family)